ncbi:MAG: DegT/DnrJ/EryC1/StrS family aminotransferase [Deltaproteobacteria bacterium]|jgi:dTDP-4-amino-4,6-dideoxygalactose transaminase|nr:DegT/DnrJ/EryC1/StrS family aminotransferase [Deltaproteobacteria bacterium]
MSIPIVKMPFSPEDNEKIAQEARLLLASGQLAMGEKTLLFERAFSEFIGTPYALSVGSGTQALEIIFRALDPSGASVCVPALTFMATAFAPIAAGAKIVLVDVDPATLQMDPEDLRKKMRTDTRAVILVHLGGFISPEYQEIKDIAARGGAVLIEDASHAHGAEICGHKAGTLGLAAAFSFYATKVLTTGEGGMVTSSTESLYSQMQIIRQHGQIRPGSNIHEQFGLNYRPSELNALLGISVMGRAQAIVSSRREAARVYDELLQGTKLTPIKPGTGVLPSYYKYIVLLPHHISRELVKEKLYSLYSQRLAGEVYASTLAEQPFWPRAPETLAEQPFGLNGAKEAARRQICLPIWPGIDPEDQSLLVQRLLEVL